MSDLWGGKKIPPLLIKSSNEAGHIWVRFAFVCRRVRDGVPGPRPIHRRDRGAEEDEIHVDRGRRPDGHLERNLLAQAAGKVRSSQHCQVNICPLALMSCCWPLIVTDVLQTAMRGSLTAGTAKQSYMEFFQRTQILHKLALWWFVCI